MWKKVRLLLLAITALSLAAAFFSWKLNFLNLPLRIALEDITGQPVTFREIDYRLFNRVSIENLTVGSNFRCERMVIYVNPLTLLTHLGTPERALIRIHFSRPWIGVNDDFLRQLKNLKLKTNENGSEMRVSWDNAELSNRFLSVNNLNGKIKLAQKITGSMSAMVQGHRMNIQLSQETSGKLLQGKAAVKIAGPSANMELEGAWGGVNGEKLEISLNAPKLQWHGFAMTGSTGTIAYSNNGFSAAISNRAGDIAVTGKDPEHYGAQARLQVNNLTASSTGQLTLTAERNGGEIKGFIQGTGLMLKETYLGNLNLSFKRMGDRLWSCGGTLEPAHYSFNAVLKNDKDVEVYLQAGRKGFGKVIGCIEPMNLEMKFTNWPVENFPVPQARFPELKGMMNLQGKWAGKTGKFFAMVSGLRMKGSNPVSFIGRCTVKPKKWMCSAESIRKDWTVAARSLEGGEWEVQGSFDRLEIQDYLPWMQADIPLKIRVSGNARYSSEMAGEAHLEARDIAWNNETIGNGKVNLKLTPDELEIKEFSIHSGKGTATCHAQIGLTPDNNTCKAQMVFHKFLFSGLLLHGPVNITGRLAQNNSGRSFEGVAASNDISINQWKTDRCSADIGLSRDRLDIRNMVWDPLLRGNVSIHLATQGLSGKLNVKNLPLMALHPSLQGHLSGELLLASTLRSPQVVLRYAVTDAKYRTIAFRHSGTAVMRNGEVYLEQVKMSAGDGTVDVSGKAWPDLNITGSIRDFPIKLVTGGSIPAKGDFSGPFTIAGDVHAPNITLEVSGKNVAYGAIPVSECKGKLNYHEGNVTFESLSAHINDSEVRVLPDSRIDLPSGKFKVSSEWRNVHLGPFDCFGTLRLDGSWQAGKEPGINGILEAENFWLNQHNVDKMRIGVRYANGVVSFQPQGDDAVTIAGTVDVRQWPQLKFYHWMLKSKDAQTLTIDGDIGTKAWQFSMAGKGVSANAVTEVFSLPVVMSGAMDINIVGRGSIEQPIIEANLSCANGSISEVPYDSLNIQCSVRQDVLTLTRARIMKKGQYAVAALGYMPFFLTSEGKKKVIGNPIDMTLNIEEGTLNLLAAASSDIRSASGGLRAQSRITGTLAKPVTNGYLKVTNGAINSKRYFNRISELNIDVLWKDNLLTVNECSGRIGEGRVVARGAVTFSGFAPKEYQLSFESMGKRGVPITVPELPIPSPLFKTDEWELFSNLSHGEPMFSLSLKGPGDNPVLGGWIELENTHFTYPSLAKSGEGESFFDPLFEKLLLDLEIRSGKNTWYDNELCSVNIMGGIRLNGKWFSPGVSGRVESVRGMVSYLGTEFKIKQATLEIIKDTAYLEAEADTEIFGKASSDNDIIQLYIDKANIEHIKPRFVSKNDPDMTPEKALAKATGIDPEVYSQSDQEYMLRQQLIRLVDSTLTTPLARGLLRKSGIADTFRVQYLSQERIKPLNPANPTLTELLYGTKYSLEKYLSDRMLFGYSVTFDQIQNRLDLRHAMELSYRWQKNIFLKGIYELETSNPARQHDRRIMVEQQWRFGPSRKSK